MEHPKFVKKVHRIFNPLQRALLKSLESLKATGGKVSDAEIERLRHPNDFTSAQVYALLASVTLLMAAIIGILIWG